MLTVECSQCKKSYQVAESDVGTKKRCRHCKNIFIVPMVEADTEPQGTSAVESSIDPSENRTVSPKQDPPKSYFCSNCGKKIGGLSKFFHTSLSSGVPEFCGESCRYSFKSRQQEKERDRVREIQRESERTVIVSTTSNIDGYTIAEYRSIESVHVVIGTGLFTEIAADITDLFGARSGKYESKMEQVKVEAIKELKRRAYLADCNAVVGVHLDYEVLPRGMMAVVATGTAVVLSKQTGNDSEST